MIVYRSHISDQVTDIGEDYQVDNNTDVLEQSEPSNGNVTMKSDVGVENSIYASVKFFAQNIILRIRILHINQHSI